MSDAAPTFWATSVFWVVASAILMFCGNYSAKGMQRRIDMGTQVCAEHGGLIQFDITDEYECKDGTLIELSWGLRKNDEVKQ